MTTARYRSTNTVFVTTTNSLTIINGPRVAIEFPAGPYYRGNEIDIDLDFSYLNNLQDRSGLSYRADVMRIISADSRNYADPCEGTGLGNVDKSSDVNNHLSNRADSPSGSINGQDPDGTVEIDAKVADTCETGAYSLTVQLWNSSKNELMTAKKGFVVTTDPNATPFAKMILSSNAVEVGTEIRYTAKFYDLASYEGKSVKYRSELTKDGADAPDTCKDGLYDIDVGGVLHGNPGVSGGDIPSNCPEGSYTIKVILKDADENELLTASADFTIGNPVDLEPEAPKNVPSYTARQNDWFSEQLPEGSGGNGALTYGATGLPAGLDFNESTRTIHGTPTEHGIFTVRYTVTDSDGDSAHVNISLTVEQDLQPTFGSTTIPNYTGLEDSVFTQQLPTASSGNGSLKYDATGLPAGLTFIASTRTITGTPPTPGIGHVDYTATDTDGDVARQSFIITITTDLQPVLDPQNDLTGRVGSHFAKFLSQATGGNGTLEYEVSSPLPADLEFIDSLVKIKGTPTEDGTTTVTLTVTDKDGDTDSHDFQIVIQPDNQPTLAAVDNFTGRVGSTFDESLPQGSGGDGDLDHDITTTLPDGLTFNEAQFKISGTPTTHGNTDVTYVVTDEDGDQATRSFRITIERDNQPALGTIPGYNAKVGDLFTQDLIAATGGDGDIGYTADPLPAGLVFIESSRTITGTPTTDGTTSVVYTATDEDGDEVQKTFDIVVYLKPSLADVSDVMATKDALFTLELPEVEGGRGPFRYTASPRPAGLNFNRVVADYHRDAHNN